MAGTGQRRRVQVTVVVLVAAALAAAGWAAPASAAPPAPMVGDCYDLAPVDLSNPDGWLEVVPVDCTRPHTFEVTSTGSLPAEDDAWRIAGEQCGDLGVWNEVGVNRPMAGRVARPLRIGAASFAVRVPSPTFVCGAIAYEVAANGAREPLTLTTSIEGLTAQQRDGLRFCSRAAGVRRPASAPATVPCTVAPRWEVTAWILWSAFYDEDPGRVELRARAARLCGPGARFSLPQARDWTSALPWTHCFVRRP